MFRQQLTRYCRPARLLVASYGPAHFRIDNNIVRELRSVDYLEQWRLASANNWYHVRLEDNSLFLFNTEAEPSYSFLQCPLNVPSLREHIEARGRVCDSKSCSEFDDEYQELLSTAKYRKHVTPIRYDVAYSAYRAGVHPAAHVHIGLENHVRIGVEKEMTPIAFFLFVVRQMYPACWSRLVENYNGKSLQKVIRDDLKSVPPNYFCELDQLQLCLK